MNCPLPIGIEDFKELIENNYYYVDKTGFVKELLNNRSLLSWISGRASENDGRLYYQIKPGERPWKKRSPAAVRAL
ncbi:MULTISPECIES: AAA family ATPase [unclassified Eisenbergiella]|uniref:AAA family ATPase n=1 Tax=unclassified Eisenbergiella TaxID=2652273 RepID=UPI000E51568F|nr:MULTISPECIES: AAA family ATPase [unclassified Eisenbergiella]MBS5535330.1 AAA family ATPase [Lachnospiraceae bacterium]RHP87463.1 hypothetical protein DXA36_16435 [Eisenbergiella sp. OF01-20]BDF44115.1 hypothetical protein CE91St56_12380 [Lachnospiraceae bacterium]GKH40178.1 hypothetical protein CE91St57_11520 [Lachnospiraceae bacterium]